MLFGPPKKKLKWRPWIFSLFRPLGHSRYSDDLDIRYSDDRDILDVRSSRSFYLFRLSIVYFDIAILLMFEVFNSRNPPVIEWVQYWRYQRLKKCLLFLFERLWSCHDEIVIVSRLGSCHDCDRVKHRVNTRSMDTSTTATKRWLVVYLMLLGSSRPYPGYIVEENERHDDNDDNDVVESNENTVHQIHVNWKLFYKSIPTPFKINNPTYQMIKIVEHNYISSVNNLIRMYLYA